MSELVLVKLSISYSDTIAAYKREFVVTAEHLYGGARLADYDQLSDWLAYVERIATKDGVEEGRSPSSTFLCIRQSDGKMVGICNIRHHLNQEYLMNIAGTIGYSICPSERQKGYAIKQLRLALEEAKKLNITRALVTCDVANIASEKTILANGGVFDNIYNDPKTHEQTKRYWIEVT